jgi:adenine-specific DNA-methyltransferase
MTIEKLRPAFTFTEDRLHQLQQIVPEAFADGKINWEALRQALGEHLEDDAQEHFGLTWPGKREARRLAALPPQGTLVPAHGEGIDEETTHNLFIEGENLEVLKLLQKSYAGRVKLIYIDPPYNTGNDFVYEDDYSEPLETYLKRTSQMDEAGRMLTTNPRASGRFHSRWLSMIYPRLLLARQLLREDGVIFVSIDDNEVHHLRLVMNEVFGEENFIVCIIWQHSIQPKGYVEKFSLHHNYILMYRKSSSFELVGVPRTSEHNRNYANPDNDPNGPWRSGDVRNALYRPNLIYDIQTPSGKVISPPKNGWRWSRETLMSKIKSGEIIFSQDESRIIHKIYLKNVQNRAPESIWFGKEVGTTRDANNQLKELFEDNVVFDTSKPTGLLKKMLRISLVQDDGGNDEFIVMDFFAGSGSLAQTVLEFNKELDNKVKCTFICVQIPEVMYKNAPSTLEANRIGLYTVSDIGKERVRRVIRKMKEAAAGGQLSLPAAEDASTTPLDLGFKVFKLARSHFKPWTPLPPADAQTLDGLFDQHASPLVEGWTKDGLLSEILLIEGFPLDSRVIPLEAFTENVVWRVHHADVAHELFVCLDEKIQPATIERLKSGAVLGREDLFICLDSALSDEAKVVLDDRLRLKVI